MSFPPLKPLRYAEIGFLRANPPLKSAESATQRGVVEVVDCRTAVEL